MAYFSNRCTEKELETMAVKDKTIQKVLEYETYFKITRKNGANMNCGKRLYGTIILICRKTGN